MTDEVFFCFYIPVLWVLARCCLKCPSTYIVYYKRPFTVNVCHFSKIFKFGNLSTGCAWFTTSSTYGMLWLCFHLVSIHFWRKLQVMADINIAGLIHVRSSCLPVCSTLLAMEVEQKKGWFWLAVVRHISSSFGGGYRLTADQCYRQNIITITNYDHVITQSYINLQWFSKIWWMILNGETLHTDQCYIRWPH